MNEYPINQYRSLEINHLIGALAKAQGSYKTLIPNQDSNTGRFANLESILLAVRESLSVNGLGFYQYIELLEEGTGVALLRTVLAHESGQFISSCARVIPGETERKTGNIYESHKKFHALMILGIAPSNNDPEAFDDNGAQLAEEALMKKLRKPSTTKNIEIDRSDVVNKTQYEELLLELEGYPDIAKEIMESHHIETIADLPAEEYQRAKSRILRIKRNLEEYARRK